MSTPLMTMMEELKAAHEKFKKSHDEALAMKADKGSIDALKETELKALNDEITKLQKEIGEIVALKAQVKEMEDLYARASAPGAARDPKVEAEEKLGAVTLMAMKKKVPVETMLASGEEVDMKAYRSYKMAFSKLLRSPGSLTQSDRMALEVGADPQGGYWVPPDVSGRMIEFIYETSPMRAYASSTTIGTDALEGPRDLDEADSGWVGDEHGSITETDTPDVGEYRIPVHQQYAMPKITEKLLDDAQFPVESWLMNKVAGKFSRRENTAFITGNGVKQPRGILTYSAGTPSATTFEVIQQRNSGAAGAFASSNPADPLIDLTFDVKAPLRAGAIWAMNSQTEAATRKLKDGQGNYLWQPSFSQQRGGLLLGYSVVNFEDMPDLAANSLSIAFGNFREGYQIVDRRGIRLLKDPYTSKGYMLFYMTKRVGGDVLNFEAIKIMKFAA